MPCGIPVAFPCIASSTYVIIEQSIELDCHVVLETPETATAMRRPRVRRMRRQLGGGGSQKRHRQVEARQGGVFCRYSHMHPQGDFLAGTLGVDNAAIERLSSENFDVHVLLGSERACTSSVVVLEP
ncbi:hypothetical protein RI054_36g137360 [Pseudoscourfieldia marina]